MDSNSICRFHKQPIFKILQLCNGWIFNNKEYKSAASLFYFCKVRSRFQAQSSIGPDGARGDQGITREASEIEKSSSSTRKQH